jgi:hypothetical protein
MTVVYTLLGFHNYNSLSNECGYTIEDEASLSDQGREETFEASKVLNITHFLGYIPIVGIFSGYKKLVTLKKEEILSNKIYKCVRSIFEILGGGLLFLPLDLAISLHRHLFTNMPPYPSRNSNITYIDAFKKLAN